MVIGIPTAVEMVDLFKRKEHIKYSTIHLILKINLAYECIYIAFNMTSFCLNMYWIPLKVDP